MRTRLARGNAGTALVTALLVFSTVIVVSFAFFTVNLSLQRRNAANLDDGRAFLLAQAGLRESFEALRGGGTGGIASFAAPAHLGGGYLWVDVEDLPSGSKRLVSTAVVGGGRKAVAAVISGPGGSAPLFETLLNSKEQLTLNQGVVVDSFDSSTGTYASQAVNVTNGHTHANTEGDVRSNANIVLNSLASVFGDASPGPSGSVIFNMGSYVHGSTLPSLADYSFPPISFPSYASAGSVVVPTNGTGSVAPGDYDLTDVTINKDGVLTIEGPANLVVDNFMGGKDGRLEIDATNGPVTIYVRSSYTHTSGFEADAAPGSPLALAFLIDPVQDVIFPSATNIRGAYYAPNANIVFSNGNECWGAFAANRIDMSNDMRFHFDEDLINHWDADTGLGETGITIEAWSEARVEPEGLLRDRRDARIVLGVDPHTAPLPADSWQVAP